MGYKILRYDVDVVLAFLYGGQWMSQSLGDICEYDHLPSNEELDEVIEIANDYYHPDEDSCIELHVYEISIPEEEPPSGSSWNESKALIGEY